MKTEVKALCNKGIDRKYRGIRLNSHWYSGLPTVDTLACSLNCAPCWLHKAKEPEWISTHGKFYKPQEIAQVLKPYSRARISGGEPCLNPEHLLAVASYIPDTHLLIETSGVDLDEDHIRAFSQVPNIYLRLSFKGVDDRSSEITCGEPIYSKQLEVAHLLAKHGCHFHIAIMGVYADVRRVESEIPGCSSPQAFTKSSSRIGILEQERLKIYPFHRDKVSQWLSDLKKEGYR